MIEFKVNNLLNDEVKVFELSSMADFEKLKPYFGKIIDRETEIFYNYEAAAKHLAEYLSNHHLHIEIIDKDEKKIKNTNLAEDVNKEKKEIKSLQDLKDIFEHDDVIKFIDIPKEHWGDF